MVVSVFSVVDSVFGVIVVVSWIVENAELDIEVVVVVFCVVGEVELNIGVVEVVSDVFEEVVLVELTGNSVVVVVVDPSSTIRLSISSVIPDFSPSSGCVINIFSSIFVFLLVSVSV
jgi:hypothetical protein